MEEDIFLYYTIVQKKLSVSGNDFHELVKSGQPLKKMETDFMLRVLDYIKTFEDEH